MSHSISSHEAVFLAYAKRFCDAEKTHKDMLLLKITHTQHVLEHMRFLVQHEERLCAHTRECLLAALYHDVGRFVQFSRYGTFKDAQSVNHGFLGVRVCKEEGFLANEPVLVRQRVLAAIGMHNRFTVPRGLSPEVRHITHAVRDADKLDILRIMAEQFANKDASSNAVVFYAKDEPEAWSAPILCAIMNNRMASYADITYINDFKLLLGSWVHDLHFPSSRHLLAKTNHIPQILEQVPNAPEVQKAKAYILQKLSLLTKEYS